jgi:hypothetical protein
MNEGNLTKLTIILSAAFYFTSLTQTAYCTGDCKSSIMVLLVGLLGILTEMGALISFIIDKINGETSSISSDIGATFTWLANPIILIALIILRDNKRIALVLSISSTILIVAFLLFDKVINNEAGHYNKITELKLGYWLWLLSSMTILIGSLIIIKKSKSNK